MIFCNKNVKQLHLATKYSLKKSGFTLVGTEDGAEVGMVEGAEVGDSQKISFHQFVSVRRELL